MTYPANSLLNIPWQQGWQVMSVKPEASKRKNNCKKSFFGVIALGVSCIAIELIPVSRQAAYWNRCLDNTVNWMDKKGTLKGWEQKAKESFAVGICNGAVYEPTIKTK